MEIGSKIMFLIALQIGSRKKTETNLSSMSTLLTAGISLIWLQIQVKHLLYRNYMNMSGGTSVV